MPQVDKSCGRKHEGMTRAKSLNRKTKAQIGKTPKGKARKDMAGKDKAKVHWINRV